MHEDTTFNIVVIVVELLFMASLVVVVSKRLHLLVEGESLFNDGTALVVFKIILGIVLAGTFSVSNLGQGMYRFHCYSVWRLTCWHSHWRALFLGTVFKKGKGEMLETQKVLGILICPHEKVILSFSYKLH